MNDYRTDAAYYYDLSPSHPDDVPFYLELVDENTEVLELGCGTGRVLVPLAQRVALIHGVDHSEGMMGRCRRRLADSGLPADNVRVVQGDITQIDMGRRYDLVTAPFHCSAHELLGQAVLVRVGAIDEVDPQVKGPLDGGPGCLLAGGTAKGGAQADRGDLEARTAELAMVHHLALLLRDCFS